MRSLWTIAELSHRQIYPPGKEEAKNTLEEFVETARDKYAALAFQAWVQLGRDDDLSMIESMIVERSFDVKENDEEEFYIETDLEVMDLPGDRGVLRVKPRGCRPMTKTTKASMNLFENDPGEKVYYRMGKQFFFPEGFDKPNVKKVAIMVVSVDGIDEKMMVPDVFASQIRDALDDKYGRTVQVPADKTNNQNPNE